MNGWRRTEGLGGPTHNADNQEEGELFPEINHQQPRTAARSMGHAAIKKIQRGHNQRPTLPGQRERADES